MLYSPNCTPITRSAQWHRGCFHLLLVTCCSAFANPPAGATSAKAVKPMLQPFFRTRCELYVNYNLVFKEVVPVSLHFTLIALVHEGHQDLVHTKQHLHELYWFLGIDTLVHLQISTCSLCVRSEKSAKVFGAPLQTVPLLVAPWSKQGLDIVGPFESQTWDSKSAISFTDFYWRWPEVAFTSSVTTETVLVSLCLYM